MKAKALWPLAVVGALAVTVAANVALLVVASDSRHIAVEPDYYAKAVAWDSTMAVRDGSRALGWRLDAELAPAPGGASLRVAIADPGGAPVAGAAVRVEAIHNLDSERRVRAPLRESGPGRYEAALPLGHRGLWELRFDATRGSERYVVSLRRDLTVLP
ncbi:MAG TPA: FixH family protein [Acidobacteriota bacterium]|nr:FixH family protein [Acidobacteriota bacterium]